MYDFGSIVLTRFPFTDLAGSKFRPALVVSRDNHRRPDLILAFITSQTRTAANPDALPIQPSVSNGLKVPSVVRFDKLATIDARLITGKLGDAEGVFGFGAP
jgi:mRNA interferase MazF